jgi:hypothetical protein
MAKNDWLMKNCWKEPKTAFERIGLYYVTNAGYFNFCDIHLIWSHGTNMVTDFDPDHYHQSYFTGPRGAVKDITSFDRRNVYKSVYNKNDNPQMSKLNLESGGFAFVRKDQMNEKIWNAWLFGPLTFEGAPYGSLLVKIEGFKLPVMKPYVDEKRRFWSKPIFPANNGTYFQPCTLWGSDFSEFDFYGKHKHDQRMGKLNTAQDEAKPIRKPDFAKRVVWRIDAFSGAVSECEAYEEHGQTRGLVKK